MADVQENHETPVVNEEVDAKRDAEPVETTAENGAEEEADAAKENGEKDAPADSDVAADADAAVAVGGVEPPVDTTEENGEDENASKEANGDSTDSTPAESVKRKVVDGGEKSEETAVTPEKKAKLDEATKDDVQNGSEASEVAA